MKPGISELDRKQSSGRNGAPMPGSRPKNSTPSLSQPPSEQVNPGSPPLRRGKWTPEEEIYVHAAIRDFNSGYLDAEPGTTLRRYLSEKLRCDPMRITKKFTGDASIGKKVFRPAIRDAPKILKDIKNSQAKLHYLYQQYKQRLEFQEREIARKSMSLVVSVASTMLGVGCMRVQPEALTGSSNVRSVIAKSSMTKTATWLDQAEALLSKNVEKNQIQKEIEEEMKEISKLINDAPAILSISTALPKLLDNKDSIVSADQLDSSIKNLYSCPNIHSKRTVPTPTTRKRERSLIGNDTVTDSPNNPMKTLAPLPSQATPVPIDACGTGKCVKADSLTNRSREDDEDDDNAIVNLPIKKRNKNTFCGPHHTE